MKNLAKKSFFYKQLYKFYYSIGDLVHPSRKNDIQMQAPIPLGFDSSLISKNLLFFAALPQTSFLKFLNHLVLSVCGLDKSTLMDAKKIKSSSAYFSSQGNILNLFHAEKKFFSQKVNLNMPIPEVITEDWIYSTAYSFLSPLFAGQSDEIYRRFTMRFPKGIEDQHNTRNLPQLENQLTLSILEFIQAKYFSSFAQCIDK